MAYRTVGASEGATRSYDRTMVLLSFVKEWITMGSNIGVCNDYIAI